MPKDTREAEQIDVTVFRKSFVNKELKAMIEFLLTGMAKILLLLIYGLSMLYITLSIYYDTK